MLKAPSILLAALAALLLALPALAADAPKLPDGMQAYLDREKPAWTSDAELVKAVSDGGANWKALAKALDAPFADASRLAATKWLIKKAPHLDRLELNADMLATNYVLAAEDAAELGYEKGSEFFYRYVLNYRLDDEPVTAWRETLRLRYLGALHGGVPGDYINPSEPDPREWLVNVANSVCKDFTVLERGFFGNLADPVSIDNSRAGTKREFALLTAAAFRSMGIGTRFVRDNRSGESWIEVYWNLTGTVLGGDEGLHFTTGGNMIAADNTGYDPNAWLPVYPTAPEHSGDLAYAAELCGGRLSVVTAGDAFGREQVTSRYSATAQIRPVFLKGEHNEEVTDFTSWSVSAWNKGAWVPLDDLEYPSSDKDYPLDEPGADEDKTVWYTVGAPGRYLLTAGLRYPGGVVYVQTSILDVEAGDHAEHYFGLDAPASLPDVALVERQIASPLSESNLLMAQGRYLFLITDDSEPSKRAETMLEPLRSHSSLNFQTHRADSADAAVQALLSEALKYDKADALPVLILVIDGQARLYLRGYNLNALDWVNRELAR